jgi:hypothetical protein
MANIDRTQWYRIDKGDGTVMQVGGGAVIRAAQGGFKKPNHAIATGRFSTPFAIYSDGYQLTHDEVTAYESQTAAPDVAAGR